MPGAAKGLVRVLAIVAGAWLVSPADACHHFDRWRYAWPQGCDTAGRWHAPTRPAAVWLATKPKSPPAAAAAPPIPIPDIAVEPAALAAPDDTAAARAQLRVLLDQMRNPK